MALIYCVEDDENIRELVGYALRSQDFEVETFADGKEFWKAVQQRVPALVLLDIMLPGESGTEILDKIRKDTQLRSLTVIMLTAKAEVDDRITGLDAGADDYLTKPFAMGELLARIRSMTRRSGSAFTPTALSAGAVELDVEEQELSCKSSVRLGNKETRLMKFFMLNAGKELPTETIFAHVWKDEDDVTEEIVWIYVSYLREKLEAIQADIQIAGEKGKAFSLIMRNEGE